MTATEPKQETNPLLEGLQLRRMPDPCALVIFGASGDLTRRKLFPALYSLALRRLLPDKFAVVGVARSEESDDEFRERMKQAIKDHARDPFELAGLSPLVTVSGSLVIALALADGAVGLEAAWDAATLDEQWQAEHWGEDEEATKALAGRRADFTAAARFLSLL